MTARMLDYFTKPAPVVEYLSTIDGNIVWPRELELFAQRIPTSLPASIVDAMPGVRHTPLSSIANLLWQLLLGLRK